MSKELNTKVATYKMLDGRKVEMYTTEGGTTNPAGKGNSCYKEELGCFKCPRGNC